MFQRPGKEDELKVFEDPKKAYVPGEADGQIDHRGPRPLEGLWVGFRMIESHGAAVQGKVGIYVCAQSIGAGWMHRELRGGY